jgi:hypothetical protein
MMGMARSSTDSTEEVALLQDLANEAVVDVLTRTKIHVRRVSLELDAGVKEYDVSNTMLRVWSLADENGAPLTEVSEGDLPSFEGGHVFQFVGYATLVLGWEPEAGDTLEAWYTPRPTDMTADAHDPALLTYGLIPEEFHGALVNYMAWKAGEITRDQGSGMGERWRRLYEGEDGYGGMGSDLGRIKWAVNRRGATGAPQGRLRRALQGSNADLGSSNWR